MSILFSRGCDDVVFHWQYTIQHLVETVAQTLRCYTRLCRRCIHISLSIDMLQLFWVYVGARYKP